ncbi:MAG: portal protein, partial [bacterium]
MADNKNLTVYQKLFYMFGQNKPEQRNTTPKYTFSDGDLITTQSQQDYNKQKLELQQQNYLEAQWARVDSELYQKAVYYETSRIASYMDYEAMEFSPEIAAALDIMSEESCTPSEQGKILTIQSNSKRVKNILEDLFYNILDIQTNLPMWTRNTCKYGDNFVYLKIDRQKGIIGSAQLTNIEIERKEEGLFGTTPSSNKGDGVTQLPEKKKQVMFHWRDKSMDFNPWEVAHFRLLGDDRRLPYGTSILEKARRIWKQLLLSEDAMLVYRVVRAPERRVFKIYVGNIDDKDVDAYVQKVANKFKRNQIVDQKTGQVDLR